jgi:hypothetical protein
VAEGRQLCSYTTRGIVAGIDKRIAVLVSWSKTGDRKQRTKPGRDAFLARFEREVDAERVLSVEERRRRAELAKSPCPSTR